MPTKTWDPERRVDTPMIQLEVEVTARAENQLSLARITLHFETRGTMSDSQRILELEISKEHLDRRLAELRKVRVFNLKFKFNLSSG